VAELLSPGPQRDAVAEVLRRRTDDLLLVGGGTASLGPAARHLAALADTPGQAAGELRHAIDVADRAGVLLWRAVTRRDLLRLDPGRSTLRDELRTLVAGTELAPFALV
jgi:hypothetical protein